MLDLRDWLSLFNVWAGLIMAVGIDPFAENQPMEGMTLGDMTSKWSPALKSFFLGLARNGLSSHPDEVSISGFIAFLRFYTLLRRDAWMFSYLPEDGGTSICEPLAARICELGGEVRLGSRVTRVAREGESWRVTWETAEGEESACAIAGHPGDRSQERKENLCMPVLANAWMNCFSRGRLSNAVIRLWFDRKPRTTAEAGIFTGDFTAHNYFWLDRIYNPVSALGTRDERQRPGSACVWPAGDAGTARCRPADTGRSRMCSRPGPSCRDHRIGQHLQRNPETHTLPAVGPKEKYLGIETPWNNLFCAGDWVRHPAPAFFLERACLTGIEAANAVLKSRGLQTWALVDYLPPEPFVAWIEKLMKRGRQKRKQKKINR